MTSVRALPHLSQTEEEAGSCCCCVSILGFRFLNLLVPCCSRAESQQGCPLVACSVSLPPLTSRRRCGPLPYGPVYLDRLPPLRRVSHKDLPFRTSLETFSRT